MPHSHTKPKQEIPAISGIYETVLYGEDLAVDGSVVLVFDPGLAGRPGRPVPSQGATGPGHVAFRVPKGGLDAWRSALEERGVPLEREVEWDAGGRSLYVRDPAGNSVELTEDELWPA